MKNAHPTKIFSQAINQDESGYSKKHCNLKGRYLNALKKKVSEMKLVNIFIFFS